MSPSIPDPTGSTERRAAVNRVIDDALKAHRASQRRRHPADVTADRLGDATQKYDFTPAELDAIAVVIDTLRKIAEERAS